MSDFVAWKEIKSSGKGLFCRITEKVHGTNAQILIEKQEDGSFTIKAGSRNKWLSPGKETDNYGFARWVEDNKEELISKLKEGRFYGEWFGAGIGTANYNLTEKRLALFNVKVFPPQRPLPHGVCAVPTLYEGAYSRETIDKVLSDLKTNGSVISPGFMSPEGIVIEFPSFGHSIKEVFTPEETGWTKKKGEGLGKQLEKLDFDVSPYLQPIRLEKLLMRDSTYKDNYPDTIPDIARDYLADMVKEDQFVSLDEVRIKAVKKATYPWIRIQLG